MGLTKQEIFTPSQNYIATIAKVLGHPARIAILENIIQQDSCICGDLVNEIGLAQATISQHLKELKKIGIIKGTIEGTKVCYCIDKMKWKEIQSIFSKMFQSIDPENNLCC
ncbi:MAG: metalloregulator ArsR/SmtB family transcription factor [Saprospiraceae bacterium]|nr:metalloregulator ArsR/SmtB family transcription factor [Saprospiraceae bacterium]